MLRVSSTPEIEHKGLKFAVIASKYFIETFGPTIYLLKEKRETLGPTINQKKTKDIRILIITSILPCATPNIQDAS